MTEAEQPEQPTLFPTTTAAAQPEPEPNPERGREGPGPIGRYGNHRQIEEAIIDGRIRISTTGHWVVECQQCGNWEPISIARRKKGRTGWLCQDGMTCWAMKDAITAGEYTPRFLGKWAQPPETPAG